MERVRVFFDTSAFAKRYVNEPGTDTVLEWCERASEIGLSAVALPELVSAFCRLQRDAKITRVHYLQLKAMLLADMEDATICDLTPDVLGQAILALETNVLRSLGAIHIASAVVLKADVFVSAAKRQLEAAAKAGLNVQQV